MMKVLGLCLAALIGLSRQASTPDAKTYEAGVVEFNYVRDSGVSETVSVAVILVKYLEMMDSAPPTLDVIVFPEMTFNGMQTAVEIPNPTDKVSPCTDASFPDESLVKQISCSAKSHQRYVVVNMVTKVACPDADMIANNDPRNCSDRTDHMSYYNTNVVFDRNGTLVSQYRKFNLFGESVDKPFKPSAVWFDTDFGVRFGHFICFDLMFRSPALDLVRNENVTDIIFPTMWFSELPFLTAVQAQQHWAYTNNVNLLAAGANNPGFGSTGTGIYAGKRGSLTSVMQGSADSKLYTATVPKIGLGDDVAIAQNAVRYTKEEMAPLKLKRDQLDRYSIRFLEDHRMTPDTAISSKECHGDVCCTYEYSFTVPTENKPTDYYRFALATYHGNRTFDGFADGGVVACAVLACQSRNVSTCGVRNESLPFIHKWYKLEIKGTFPNSEQFVYFPTTLEPSIMPFEVNEYNFAQRTVESSSDGNKDYQITMTSLGDLRDEYYAFGIYGRDFNLDVHQETEGAAGIAQVSSYLVTALASLILINNMI